MRAVDIITRSPVAVTPDTRIGEALEVMDAVDVRHIPVLEDEQLVGILSDRDLRALWDPSIGTLRDARVYQRFVRELMSRDPITVEEEADIDAVITLLVEHRIGAVPVVDLDGVLVGIVSTIDILRAAVGKL